jgi:allantoicase
VARLRLWGHEAKYDPANDVTTPHCYLPICTGRTCTVVPHSSVAHEDDLPSRHTSDCEVSGLEQGGAGVWCSNSHYGTPANLLQPGLGVDMGDGWETARHPDRPAILIRDPVTNLVASPLQDWAIIKLGRALTSDEAITRIIVDTKHFRGNYPESVQIEGCYLDPAFTDDQAKELLSVDTVSLESDAVDTGNGAQELPSWFVLIPRGRLSPDAEHVYDAAKEYVNDQGQVTTQVLHVGRPISHVRIRIYPDGGISRVRIYSGQPVQL